MLDWAQNAVWGGRAFASHASALTSFLLTLFAYWSLVGLQDRWDSGRLLRRALLPIILYFLLDVILNRGYSLGSAVRDSAYPAFGWHYLCKAFDACLLQDIDLKDGKKLPKWCVPDWDKEESERKERGLNGFDAKPAKDQEKTAKPSWYERDIKIRRRPTWAKNEKTIPKHWKLLPLPTQLADQLIWALDVMFMRRPGTSTLFIEEMRSLDWSMNKLEVAGEAQRQRRQGGGRSETPTTLVKEIFPFGYVEVPFFYMLSDLALSVWAYIYFNSIHIPIGSFSNFFKVVPLFQQSLITIAMGTFIAVTATPMDYVSVPLMSNWPFLRPPTTVTPGYRDVSRSQSLTEMWGWRWHKRNQRDFVRLGLLIPFGARTNRVATLLKAFFWSAVFHSFCLARCGPDYSWSKPVSTIIVPVLLRPGTTAFFMIHGLLCLLENAMSPYLYTLAYIFLTVGKQSPAADNKLSKDTKACVAVVSAAEKEATDAPMSLQYWRIYFIWCLRLVWVWGNLLWTGRWLTAEVYAAGFLDNDSIKTMHLREQGRWYYNYFKTTLFGY